MCGSAFSEISIGNITRSTVWCSTATASFSEFALVVMEISNESAVSLHRVVLGTPTNRFDGEGTYAAVYGERYERSGLCLAHLCPSCHLVLCLSTGTADLSLSLSSLTTLESRAGDAAAFQLTLKGQSGIVVADSLDKTLVCAFLNRIRGGSCRRASTHG